MHKVSHLRVTQSKPLAALLLLGEPAARCGPLEARRRSRCPQRGTVRRAGFGQVTSGERPAELCHVARAPSGGRDRRLARGGLVALLQNHNRARTAPPHRCRCTLRLRHSSRAFLSCSARGARLRRCYKPQLRAPQRDRCGV